MHRRRKKRQILYNGVRDDQIATSAKLLDITHTSLILIQWWSETVVTNEYQCGKAALVSVGVITSFVVMCKDLWCCNHMHFWMHGC